MEIGASLREARVRRRLTVDDAHRATRIRPQYLEALEEEDFDRLPGDAYVKGFLRSYADFLELDGPALVAAYREGTVEREPPSVAQPTVLPSPRRAPLAVGTFVVVVAGAAVLGWTLREGEAEPAPATAPPPVAPVVTAPTPAPQPAKPAPAPATPTFVALTAAAGECWLEIRFGGSGGKLVWTGTLRRGRTLRLGLQRTLWIRAGAPDVLAATLGGRAAKLPPGTGDFLVAAVGIRPA